MLYESSDRNRHSDGFGSDQHKFYFVLHSHHHNLEFAYFLNSRFWVTQLIKWNSLKIAFIYCYYSRVNCNQEQVMVAQAWYWNTNIFQLYSKVFPGPKMSLDGDPMYFHFLETF